jgi:hypothetical protein
MPDPSLPNPRSAFARVAPSRQRHELREAERRRRNEFRELADATRIPPRAPGLRRDGERALRRPDFLGALMQMPGTPEAAEGLLGALRASGRVP